jgi:hypothetical protein
LRTQTSALAAAMMLITTAAFAGFSSFDDPDVPGERIVTAVVDLNGKRARDLEVHVYYSDNETAVRERRRDDEYYRGKGQIEDIGGGKARVNFIFPHRDFPVPLPGVPVTDSRSKVYNSPSTIHYFWDVSNGGGKSELRSFPMPRLLRIGYMGDSFASGEGAPNAVDMMASPEDRWDDPDAHRSSRSGGELALRKLRYQHPEWAIRWVNTTCSGAELDDFVGPDVRDTFTKPPQLEQVREWLDGRQTLDILLTDGGGNDVGFAPMGSAAMLAFGGDVRNDPRIIEMANNAVPFLPGIYDGIADAIVSERHGFKVGRVIWMNYPVPLYDKEGDICGTRHAGFCWGPVEMQIAREDFEFVRDRLLIPLNRHMAEAVARNGWTLVDISARAGNHGICNCDSPYINTIGASLTIQFDERGTMHPNATGFREIYRDPVYNQLVTSIKSWHTQLHDERNASEQARRAAAIAEAKAKARAAAAFKARFQEMVVFAAMKSNIRKMDVSKLKVAGAAKVTLKPTPTPAPAEKTATKASTAKKATTAAGRIAARKSLTRAAGEVEPEVPTDTEVGVFTPEMFLAPEDLAPLPPRVLDTAGEEGEVE